MNGLIVSMCIAVTILFFSMCLPVYGQEESKISLPDRGLCAHRGVPATHPENTLTSFKEAIRLGAHMIEFDVWLTKDGEMVVIHDDTVDRTTNGTGKVSDLTLAEIKSLDAGSWKDAKFAGEKIPTLAEALEIMPTNIWLNIHLKDKPELAEKVTRKVVEQNRLHQAFLACGVAAAEAAHKVDSKIMICNMEGQFGDTEAYVDKTIALGTDFVQLWGDAATPENIGKLKENGIRVNYFGTNDADVVRQLFEAGVDFPLTDNAGEMMVVAKEFGIAPVELKYAKSLAKALIIIAAGKLENEEKLDALTSATSKPGNTWVFAEVLQEQLSNVNVDAHIVGYSKGKDIEFLKAQDIIIFAGPTWGGKYPGELTNLLPNVETLVAEKPSIVYSVFTSCKYQQSGDTNVKNVIDHISKFTDKIVPGIALIPEIDNEELIQKMTAFARDLSAKAGE